MIKSYMAKAHEVEHKWYVVDANGKTLGRLASEVARVLRGKHKPIFTPHVDTGDFVVVINAEKVRLTGNKLQDKKYITHSRFPGGLKMMSYEQLLQKHPVRAIEVAVKGMIPHNTLGSQIYKKLKVYAGPEHPHQAQQPEVLEINE
jgi:large subunit ribosomal protein L13